MTERQHPLPPLKQPLLWLLVLAALLLGACGNMEARKRSADLQDTLFTYQALMNRSDFRLAAAMRAPDAPPWDISGLGHVHVTAYDILRSTPSADGKRHVQDIHLQYLDKLTMREHTTQYHEIWKFDDARLRWLLYGQPPAFR